MQYTPEEVGNPKFFRSSATQCLQFLAREAGDAGEGRIALILRRAIRDIEDVSREKSQPLGGATGSNPELLALLDEAYGIARDRRLNFPAFLIGVAIDGFLTEDIGSLEGFYPVEKAS